MRKNMKFSKIISAAMVATAMSVLPSFADVPDLRAAVLKFGTVNWELNTIKHHGLDKANGFNLVVQGMAGNSATRVAFQGGEADVVVADWIWVARQRADDKDFVFIPYSKAVGGLMVKNDSPVKTLADLSDVKIGIAGGPVDKSWLLLRALAAQQTGVNLVEKTEQVFGAPPLIFKSALNGDVDAAINFWHFGAKMKAAGMREVISVSDAAVQLGLNPDTPLLGYVIKGDLLRDNPDIAKGFARASQQAKEILASDDAEWDRLRPKMNAKTDAAFAALKSGFRAGIPSSFDVNEEDAAALLSVMGTLGGEKLVGKATQLPTGVFLSPES
jgi:NitT/TauT family transport system substrate-binding protein